MTNSLPTSFIFWDAANLGLKAERKITLHAKSFLKRLMYYAISITNVKDHGRVTKFKNSDGCHHKDKRSSEQNVNILVFTESYLGTGLKYMQRNLY